MSEKNLGALTWLARLTIVTKPTLLVMFLTLLLSARFALAENSQEQRQEQRQDLRVTVHPAIMRILKTSQKFSTARLPSKHALFLACHSDAVCAAKLIAKALGAKARLERVKHPTSDSIRRVKSMPSIARWTLKSPHHLIIVLNRFGRKARAEIRAALAQAQRQADKQVDAAEAISDKKNIKTLELDLRNNHGGNVNYMLRVAALFIGSQKKALGLTGKNKTVWLDVPPNAKPLKDVRLILRVGGATASSAEIFTGLMRVYGKAVIMGQKTYGKDYLLRIIPVSHDWQLLIPAETITISGVKLAGGIVPDVIETAVHD